MSLMSRSALLDGLLFAGALLIVGAGFGAAFWGFDPSPPPAEWTDADAPTASSSGAPPMPGAAPTLSSGVLTGNILDGLPRHSGSSNARMQWPSSSASAPSGQGTRATGFSSRVEASASAFGSSASAPGGARGVGGSGYGASSRGGGSAPDPGGWAGALASSSGELRRLERQVGAIGQQVRAMRATPTHQGARPIQGDERIGGPMASMEDDNPPLPEEPLDPNPPLPPDPVPVDGGLVVLALAGGAYGMRRLHATDNLS